MTDQTPIPAGYLKDAQERLVPVSTIKPQRILEHELVERLCESARALNRALAEFKACSLSEVMNFRDLVAAEYGAEIGGAKGNMTLSTYDGREQVQVQVSETLAFGPELSAAKELIDGCLQRWTKEADDKVRVLVEHAFQVNKMGRIDTQRVLSLRQIAIEDADWKRAMDAISDALRVRSSTTYIRFYEATEKSPVAQIPLSLAVL